MAATLDEHYGLVIKEIAEGRVIPFFGAGANRCGRPQGVSWCSGSPYLPDGRELAEHLAQEFKYPGSDKKNLMRVSQYAEIMLGIGPLYEKLREIFDANYESTALHKFFATLPAMLRERGYSSAGMLIVTTNYDDLIERALKEAGEEFDLVFYEAEDRQQRGKFWHRPPIGKDRIVDKPRNYSGLSLEKRSIILKLHGAIDRRNSGRDNFVITEDNYIDYLTRIDISNLIPVTVAAEFKKRHFLFLGYSLCDWNLRAILYRIWVEERLRYKSWAILSNPDPFDQKFWSPRNLDILDIRLEAYIEELNERVKLLPHKGGIT